VKIVRNRHKKNLKLNAIDVCLGQGVFWCVAKTEGIFKILFEGGLLCVKNLSV
jgi:hypothetical protein